MPDTPYSILERRLSDLQDYYDDQVEKLKTQRPPKEQWNSVIAGFQSDYDRQKFQINSLRGQLDAIRRSDIDPDLAEEAAWRLVLPQEHAGAMFPTVRPKQEGAPISPPALTAQRTMIEDFAKGAKEEPGWEWGPPKRKQESLLEQYVNWRVGAGYDDFSPGQQKQLDFQWDRVMKTHPEYQWDPTSPDVSALRTGGSRLLGEAAKRVSPLAASIQKQKSGGIINYIKRGPFGRNPMFIGPEKSTQIQSVTGPKTLDKETAQALLSEVGGDKNKARELAKQRGYQF
jgi:hypothetical protein